MTKGGLAEGLVYRTHTPTRSSSHHSGPRAGPDARPFTTAPAHSVTGQALRTLRFTQITTCTLASLSGSRAVVGRNLRSRTSYHLIE